MDSHLDSEGVEPHGLYWCFSTFVPHRTTLHGPPIGCTTRSNWWAGIIASYFQNGRADSAWQTLALGRQDGPFGCQVVLCLPSDTTSSGPHPMGWEAPVYTIFCACLLTERSWNSLFPLPLIIQVSPLSTRVQFQNVPIKKFIGLKKSSGKIDLKALHRISCSSTAPNG